jgi:hypothetical protein
MTAQPDETHVYRGIEFARWGQLTVPVGEEFDPTPAVYSSADCIEFGGEFRMDFATAESLIARLQAAIAYERASAARGAKGGEKP